MAYRDYIGKNLGAEAFKIITLYDKYKGGKRIKSLQTRGGDISKITDIKGVFEPVGDSYVMIGLQDEAGTAWTRYEPGVFNIKGRPLILTDEDTTTLTDKDNPIKQGALSVGSFAKKALLIGGGFLLLALFVKNYAKK